SKLINFSIGGDVLFEDATLDDGPDDAGDEPEQYAGMFAEPGEEAGGCSAREKGRVEGNSRSNHAADMLLQIGAWRNWLVFQLTEKFEMHSRGKHSQAAEDNHQITSVREPHPQSR